VEGDVSHYTVIPLHPYCYYNALVVHIEVPSILAIIIQYCTDGNFGLTMRKIPIGDKML